MLNSAQEASGRVGTRRGFRAVARQCGMGRRCRREILMLVAQARFGARIDKVYHAYPRALERLAPAAAARRGAQ